MKTDTGGNSLVNTNELTLANSRLAISFLPHAGGNISSIRDRNTDRNWLWQNPYIPITNNRRGPDYGKSLDSGGWDEMLLSIAACKLELDGAIRVDVPDHGDLVRRSWDAQVYENETGQQSCRMTAFGATLNYTFTRTAQLRNELPEVNFKYSLSNDEEFAWPFFWCPHVLLAAHSSMRIELPDRLPLHMDGEIDQEVSHWPNVKSDDGSPINIADCFAKDKNSFAHKIFVQTPSSGKVAVSIRDTGERLTMTVDPSVLPWIGLWINNRGWSGCGSQPYQNLGLEPSTAGHDSVAKAMQNEAIDWIKPHETREWSVTLELHS